ncbi:TPA: hypothetical protein EYO12_03110 [Candidatus Saccharibacteria bacterium]|nr:hypothetical protein [Candidatus Saccharibacteria bacterium]HIO87977.1 hypothetical protein [Candidatus Saccharibacteria bacterium]
MKKYLEKLLPLLQALLKLKVIILSLIVFIILSLTITQAQKVGDSMLDRELIDKKRLEIQANKVEFDQETIDIIYQRVKEANLEAQPVDDSTSNPFFYN